PTEHDTAAHVVSVVDLLLTIGYIDGTLHDDEKAFIRGYLDRLIDHVAHPLDSKAAWRAQIDSVYDRLDGEIAAIASEVVAADDESYVRTRLKVRAVALFRGFSPADQRVALELLNAVVHTDGTVSPAEQELHEELLSYFHAQPTLIVPEVTPPEDMLTIDLPIDVPLVAMSHPWLDTLEQPYSKDPATLLGQLNSDYNLVFEAIKVWERQRARGNGRLIGITDVAQLAPGTRILDGHVHVQRPSQPTELIVLGDLHGCYSALKAALLQSDFIERALRHQADPVNNPDVKLVLLGDYIDRGRFSFEGVLRAALQLLVSLPEHVILLRGNHEYLVRMGERIVSAVNPAEAVPALSLSAPVEVLEAYRHLFDHMPTSFLFDRTLFVHGGIPRDDTLAERYRDLSSLDDSVMRFEMMWGDPVNTDHVPGKLQRESPRFNFGRDQFRSFMERVGAHTMIRGHEQVDRGFETFFDLGTQRLHTLFSSGGRDNSDLPAESRYRSVSPLALTVRTGSGPLHAVPWALKYQPFTTAEHNGLYR
ncbi:MAG: metallophosphoesterase family protein, partial [Polyangiales bacterium]